MTLYFDNRWSGDHGIGRVSRMIDKGLGLPHLNISGKPSSPLDPLKLLCVMLRLPKTSLVISPGYNAPLLTVRPYIFIIHDLNHLDFPLNSSFFKQLYYKIILRRACRKALRVLTVSEFSRQRIIQWSGVSESQVVNIGNGVDECFNPNVASYEPGYQYYLCVSNRKPHKNEDRLLDAFATSHIDSNIRLIFTGIINENMASKCRTLGIENRVVFLGRVSEYDLPGLYKGAIALLFPSLYEGFGLPVIEAMACGTPVLTSNSTSLSEVAGNAGLLVNPESAHEISHGIESLYKDEELRNLLCARGLLRARLFRWETVVSRVKNVLDEYVNGENT